MRVSLDQVLRQLRTTADPYQRLRDADELDQALVAARSAVTMIKKATVNELRDRTTGYGTIAGKLGVTKTRVQQIANAADKHGPVVVAVKDETDRWYGQPDLAGGAGSGEAETANPFRPANQDHPLYGQKLLARWMDLPYDEHVSLYALHLHGDDGSIRPTRMTLDVFDTLFGTTTNQPASTD
ncbi:hypothetical protein AB0J55_28560 [Amycolatopsis sp. NPDC049688]|uniref:hypothetical protein n=1 Tax=Amycolatopsis sp. NPDC049688 TaxID=3154733 RepID=UPI00343F111E